MNLRQNQGILGEEDLCPSAPIELNRVLLTTPSLVD